MFEILNDFISFPFLVCTSSYKDLDPESKVSSNQLLHMFKTFLIYFTSRDFDHIIKDLATA